MTTTPCSGFMYYVTSTWGAAKASGTSYKDHMKTSGSSWKSMTDATKAPYMARVSDTEKAACKAKRSVQGRLAKMEKSHAFCEKTKERCEGAVYPKYKKLHRKDKYRKMVLTETAQVFGPSSSFAREGKQPASPYINFGKAFRKKLEEGGADVAQMKAAVTRADGKLDQTKVTQYSAALWKAMTPEAKASPEYLTEEYKKWRAFKATKKEAADKAKEAKKAKKAKVGGA